MRIGIPRWHRQRHSPARCARADRVSRPQALHPAPCRPTDSDSMTDPATSRTLIPTPCLWVIILLPQNSVFAFRTSAALKEFSSPCLAAQGPKTRPQTCSLALAAPPHLGSPDSLAFCVSPVVLQILALLASRPSPITLLGSLLTLLGACSLSSGPGLDSSIASSLAALTLSPSVAPYGPCNAV